MPKKTRGARVDADVEASTPLVRATEDETPARASTTNKVALGCAFIVAVVAGVAFARSRFVEPMLSVSANKPLLDRVSEICAGENAWRCGGPDAVMNPSLAGELCLSTIKKMTLGSPHGDALITPDECVTQDTWRVKRSPDNAAPVCMYGVANDMCIEVLMVQEEELRELKKVQGVER